MSRAIELAAPGAHVHVFTIARVHGVAFGIPSPGLLPTKAEWAEQKNIVAKTIGRLERKGMKADGHVLGTRNAAKKIVQEAIEHDCEAIVMSADPDRNRWSATCCGPRSHSGCAGAPRCQCSLWWRRDYEPTLGGRAAARA